MLAKANPLEEGETLLDAQKQTAELRSADCSADVYQLIAGMVVAARLGLEMPDGLDKAEKKYVSVNIHSEENQQKLAELDSLPDSCEASANALEAQRGAFEAEGVFAPQMIDGILKSLRKHRDHDLRKKLENSPARMLEEVRRHWHCG